MKIDDGDDCVGGYPSHYCVSFLSDMKLAVLVSPQLLHTMEAFPVCEWGHSYRATWYSRFR